MATQTFPLAEFSQGLVKAEFDVNTANWRMSQIRCYNNSDWPVAITVLKAGVPVFQDSAPAHQTTSWNTTGVQIAWDAVNGGLVLGDYQLITHWQRDP